MPWNHKNIWTRRSPDFTVTIEHRQEPSKENSFRGPNMWNVYAYIYPTHPHFYKFNETNDFFQNACNEMPFHGGVSFFTRHINENNELTSIQVGSDYGHLNDERFSYDSNIDDASTQFRDANILFDWLNKQGSTEAKPISNKANVNSTETILKEILNSTGNIVSNIYEIAAKNGLNL